MKRNFKGMLFPFLGILSFWIIGGKDYGEAIIIAFIGGLLAVHLYVNQRRVWEGREFILTDIDGRTVGVLSAESKDPFAPIPSFSSKIVAMPALTFFHPDGEKGLMLYLNPEGQSKGGGISFFSKDGQRKVGCGIFDDKSMGLFVAGNESLEPGISIEISKGELPVILIKNKEGELLWNSPTEKKE